MDAIIILGAFSLLSIGPLLIWPSRFNIPAIQGLGFLLTGYAIPIFFTDTLQNFSREVVDLYTWLMVTGAVAYTVGLVLGNVGNLSRFTPFIYRFDAGSYAEFERDIYRIVRRGVLFGTVGMALCFVGMGFIPAFAADPFLAKFFRGPYQEPYQRVAILYRISFIYISFLAPVLLCMVYERRKFFDIALFVAVALLLILSLVRGQIADGIVFFAGVLIAKKYRSVFWIYLVFLVVIYPLGASSYLIVASLFNLKDLGAIYDVSSIFTIIASGAPDIADHLNFLDKFDLGRDINFGATFVGGLVPGNFAWNPAIWALKILNPGQDLADMSSGGLRLPVPIWGYVAFGFPGVALVSGFSGYLLGLGTKFARMYSKGPLLQIVVVLLFYKVFWGTLSGFYVLSMYSLPAILIGFYLIYKMKLSIKNASLRFIRRRET